MAQIKEIVGQVIHDSRGDAFEGFINENSEPKLEMIKQWQ